MIQTSIILCQQLFPIAQQCVVNHGVPGVPRHAFYVLMLHTLQSLTKSLLDKVNTGPAYLLSCFVRNIGPVLCGTNQGTKIIYVSYYYIPDHIV